MLETYDDELKVFLVTATPVIHSGKFHFHFDSDALLLGQEHLQVISMSFELIMCREPRNGLGSLLPFPLPPISMKGGTQLVLPLDSLQGKGASILLLDTVGFSLVFDLTTDIGSMHNALHVCSLGFFMALDLPGRTSKETRDASS